MNRHLMKHLFFQIIVAAVAVCCLGGLAEAQSDGSVTNQERRYEEVIDKRADKIVQALRLADTNAERAVQGIIVKQYKDLNAWHAANDPEVKLATRRNPAQLASLRSSLLALHQSFLASLAQWLNESQIEAVKDAMTYGKVQFTFAGYCAQYPSLTDANKQVILRMLKEAREEAMDQGNAHDKTAVFQKYKGKINNYLFKSGIIQLKKKKG